jgi:hypothetical protein
MPLPEPLPGTPHPPQPFIPPPLPGPVMPPPVTLGPLQNYLLLLLLIALLKRLGIIPADEPDDGFTSTAAVLTWVGTHNPPHLLTAQNVLYGLTTGPVTVTCG